MQVSDLWFLTIAEHLKKIIEHSDTTRPNGATKKSCVTSIFDGKNNNSGA